MGGCCKGERCPFSHELVQRAPKGVDVSGGYFISGNVANYKAAASSTAAPSSSRSLASRWDDPTTSSSTDGLSTLVSPSSCCVTMGTSLSAEAKEWVSADSAAASPSANSATASITPIQSQRGATSPNICARFSSLRYRSAAARRTAHAVSPLLMPHAQRNSKPQPQQVQTQPQPQSFQEKLPSPPLPPSSQPHEQHKRQYQQLPQPRSAGNTLSALLSNHSESSAAAEARPTSPVPAHPAATARTVPFRQSSSDSGALPIATLASFNAPCASTAVLSATPSSATLQPSNVAFLRRHDDQTPPAAAAQSFTSSHTATILATATPTPAHGSRRTATRGQHVESPLPRTREALETGAEHHAATVANARTLQSTAALAAVAAPKSSPHYEVRTVSSAQTRVMPPAPRSQQQQAAHQAQQHAQLQQRQQETQPQKQQQTVYMVTTSRPPATTPWQGSLAAPAQLPLGYTLAYAIPASTSTAPMTTPILISEQPSTARPAYTLLSSCPPQSQLQSFRTTTGTVLYAAPVQALPQAAAPSESEAPRLVLANIDGIFTIL
nr:unnamed protein product [Leishmania braziliensis]